MSDDDDSDKSFEPTDSKLRKAREKGEVAKSADLSVAAAYMGLVVAFYGAGHGMVTEFGTVLMSIIDQPARRHLPMASRSSIPVQLIAIPRSSTSRLAGSDSVPLRPVTVAKGSAIAAARSALRDTATTR